uniref:Uncharacterized protein n=1 Tax=Capra hircus TaxID=9925 RepID=A0A8C2PFK6_CAPHI
MAEGDEVTRSQEPHQGLRRRRRTSDSNTGVNHVSHLILRSPVLLNVSAYCTGKGAPLPLGRRTRFSSRVLCVSLTPNTLFLGV